MGLKELPEWAKKNDGGDPLEAEVRQRLADISLAIRGSTNKTFTVESADGRLVVSMQREDGSEPLFTVSQVDNEEYLLMDADATPRDLPIFVGPRAEMFERMKNEILYTYLESWERPEITEPDADDDDVPGLSAEDLEMLERLINPPKDGQPPPGLN
jgi:hypothetical protein